MIATEPSNRNPKVSDSVMGMQRVCAVVVTFNRSALLTDCLDALLAQSRPPDGILVVDNASTDGTAEILKDRYPAVRVQTLTSNLGGSGGFHAGCKQAYEEGFDWLWLMDDDGRPTSDCLDLLLNQASPMSAVVPVQEDKSGKRYGIGTWKGMDVNVTESIDRNESAVEGKYIFSFVGPLISREIVQAIGLPNPDFFIWFDDIEYALRIANEPSARIVVVPNATFYHDFGGSPREVRFMGRTSVRPNQPAWKSYYNARNPLYIVTRVRPDLGNLAFYVKSQFRSAIGELLYEHDRWDRLRFRTKGIFDGAIGKLGKRH